MKTLLHFLYRFVFRLITALKYQNTLFTYLQNVTNVDEIYFIIVLMGGLIT